MRDKIYQLTIVDYPNISGFCVEDSSIIVVFQDILKSLSLRILIGGSKMMGETNLKACVLMLIFFLTLVCTTAGAETIHVDDNGPSDFNTIQAAIDDSNDGDTIIVKPGVYLEYASFHGKNITVTSTKPDDYNVVASTIIEYGAEFAGTEEPNCTFKGFKINGWIGGNHTHATISYCLLSNSADPWGIAIRDCDGTISNCVIVNNMPGGHVPDHAILGCHGLIKNCTVAHNFSGIRVLGGGTTTIENCIIWGNGVWLDSGATVNILYSDVQGGSGGIYSGGDRTVNWGQGNMDADPCIVDADNGDYHLKSQAGRWEPLNQSWVQDANTSPCIDAGNPHSPIGAEPFPNGGRVNMGAYGGTAEASKSYFGRPPCEIIIAGDINGDCKINFFDFQILALHWLGGKQYIPPIPNEPPVVSITQPPDGAVTYYGFIIEIEADASDDDGVVVKVEFFANGNKIGEDNDGIDGWKINWQDITPGIYNLTATAIDNVEAETISAPIEITIKSGGPPPP